MEHQANFRRTVLPHYLKVITSVVTLDDIVTHEQELGEAEEARLRAEVTKACTEIVEAAGKGRKVLDAVDHEIQDAAAEKGRQEQAVAGKKNKVLEVENQIVREENEKQKVRDLLEKHQVEIQQATELQDRENARKAEKETFRNLGFGLVILPFIGIPMALGAIKEIKRSQALIESATAHKSEVEPKCDKAAMDLDRCQKKLEELREQQLGASSFLSGKERELLAAQEQVNQLVTSRRKVSEDLDHLTALQAQLDVLSQEIQSGFDPTVGKYLRNIISFVWEQSFGFELLGDPRVLSKLSQLDGRVQD